MENNNNAAKRTAASLDLAKSAFTLHVLSITGLFLFTSCAVGPDYERPETPGEAQNAYKSPIAVVDTDDNTPLASDWWKLFDDAELNRLIEAANQNNQDIRAAIARVAQARAATSVMQSQFFPTITLDPSVTRGRTSSNNGGSNSGRTQTNYRVPFDLSYEIDIWGRVRRSVEQSSQLELATVTDFSVVLQTIQADVAQNYFNLRSFDTQDMILNRSLELYRKQLSLTETQFKAGIAPKTDVLQAQTQLNATVTQQLEVRRQRAITEHALAILTGQPPVALNIENKALGTKIPVIPAGLPSDLLGQRPDVAEAEHRLAAASAAIGIAKANFYPKFTLTGAAGWESINTSNLFNWQSRIWSLGPALSLPIFEGGRLTAELEQAKAAYDEQSANFRQAILNAFRDVEDSLSDLHHRALEADSQEATLTSAREYLRLTEIQYEKGLVNYFQVIDADRTLLTNEISATQIQEQRLISTVLLIKALGGGWKPDVEEPLLKDK
jgi:multidrug efflux system outer membrane protein